MKPAKPIRSALSGSGPRRRTPAQGPATDPTIRGSSSASQPKPVMTYPAAPRRQSPARRSGWSKRPFWSSSRAPKPSKGPSIPAPDPDERPDADPGDEHENGRHLEGRFGEGRAAPRRRVGEYDEQRGKGELDDDVRGKAAYSHPHHGRGGHRRGE